MGGAWSALCMAVLLTIYTYFIADKCHTGQWDLISRPKFPTHLHDFFDTGVFFLTTCWILLQCVLYMAPVGHMADGVVLPSGGKLKYRMNALFVMTVNLLSLVLLATCGVDVTAISSVFPQMLTSGVICCLLGSIALSVRGYWAAGDDVYPGGNTGHLVHDWFIGRDLNPRVGLLDLKYVMFRSGIIGWHILNFVNIGTAYSMHGQANLTLLTLAVMQLLYVTDYFWPEEGVLVTRDIVHERLGYKLLVMFLMIPFCFCLQTRYLMTTNYQLSWLHLTGVICLYVFGYYIYRASNSEKNNFRKNPDDPRLSYLKSMPTSRGTRLLISGWWGRCRHPNYLGDIIIAFSFALPTGFNHVLPYFAPVLLVLLLLDRLRQDDATCRQKYGADWDKYCNIVKYKLIPWIY